MTAGTDGAVTLVGTPIGNLADISHRAEEALARADRIACEDTRRTGRLLEHLGIPAPRLVRMDEHTERAVAGSLVEAAGSGEHVVVVTDAGMPGLSDPGAEVVRAATAAGVRLEVVPGAFAGATAAVLSGLLDGSGRFTFEGFLPRRGRARGERLRELAASRVPVVVYESPNRVAATLGDLASVCGPERGVSLSRELTKLHEETWRGVLGAASEHFSEVTPRGEFVIVVEAAPVPDGPTDAELSALVGSLLAEGLSHRDAAVEAASRTGVAANRVKRIANALRSG